MLHVDKQIWSIGYSGLKPDKLFGHVRSMNAVLVDIRYSPRSRNPAWSRSHLEQGLGDRYRHVQNLGNAAYLSKEGHIKIVDMEAGIAELEAIDAPAIILMCACERYADCHRKVVMDELARRFPEQVRGEVPRNLVHVQERAIKSKQQPLF